RRPALSLPAALPILRRAARLPRRHPRRDRQIGQPQRGAGPEHVALAEIGVGPGIVTADGDAGAALRAVPQRAAPASPSAVTMPEIGEHTSELQSPCN